MLLACQTGHLDIARWLASVGGAMTDISRTNTRGRTPLLLAALAQRQDVVLWLVSQGALQDPIGGRLDLSLVRRDLRFTLAYDPEVYQKEVCALKTGLNSQISSFRGFLATILVGALGHSKSSHLWRLGLGGDTGTHLRSLVADFAGIPHGRVLRNCRDALEAVLSADWSIDVPWTRSDTRNSM